MKIHVILGLIGIFIVVGIPIILHNTTKDTVSNVVVTNKERITSSDNYSKYLIWTENETFENTDSIYSFKFDSSDIYGHIKVNSTCTFKVNWFRIKLFSMYRNILSADCVSI